MSRASVPYFQKLKDPRWQRKRLEVMQAHEFTCQLCGDTETTLHVHHKQYIKGREPWEYEADQLATVCEECHSEGHGREDVLHLVTSYLPLDGPHSRAAIASLVAGYCDLSVSLPDADFNYESAMIGILADRLFYFRSEKELRVLFKASETHEGAENLFLAMQATLQKLT